MSKINDGGPAFPVSGDVGNLEEWKHGISLRDYFAAKALPAVYSDYCTSARALGFDEDWKTGVAIDAYAMADAMLAEREKQK